MTVAELAASTLSLKTQIEQSPPKMFHFSCLINILLLLLAISCGKGEDFCAPGNCQEGTCDGAPTSYSTNGLCGSQHGCYECPPKFGLCCSKDGFCGNSTDYCGTGCQNGPCGSLLNTTTTTTSTPKSTQTPGSVSGDGTCGYSGKLVCKGSAFGDCCSAAGYCGSTDYACLDILGW